MMLRGGATAMAAPVDLRDLKILDVPFFTVGAKQMKLASPLQLRMEVSERASSLKRYTSPPRWRHRPGCVWPAAGRWRRIWSVSYTHLRAHETRHDLVCRLL